MTLAKKIYYLLKNNKDQLTTNEIIQLLKNEYNNTYGDIKQSEEWYRIIKIHITNDQEYAKKEIIKALWTIVNTGYATTEIKEENRSYTWTTYNKRKGTYKEEFQTKVRYWKVIK